MKYYVPLPVSSKLYCANTLPLINNVPFERMSLYLMELYRHLGQDTDAQRVRQNLLSNRGQSAEMQLRVSYFDVAGHLRNLAPGTAPAIADSTALVTVAGSASGFAPVACATLRYFYPQANCNAVVHRNQPSQRPAASKVTGTARSAMGQLQAFPNPANEQLSLQATGLREAAAHFQLAELSTGRVILTQPVAGEQLPTIAIGKVAPGVYVGRLLSASGQVLAGCKVVVIR